MLLRLRLFRLLLLLLLLLCFGNCCSRTNLHLARARICVRIRNAKATRARHTAANSPLNLGATTINVDHKATLRV